jgi:osmoprotectant transport system permease protein
VGAPQGGGTVIDFLGDVVRWFAETWDGGAGYLNRTREHVVLAGTAIAVSVAIALPLGAWLGHTRRASGLAASLVNVGRAIPSFGIVALSLPFTIRLAQAVPFIPSGIGFAPIFIALVALAIPPIFINTHAGVMGVDAETVEAARGMGVTEARILTEVELPMASPVILAGIRVTAVQVVATAPLGALVGFGGLGRYIIDGFSIRDNVQVFAGAVLVAALALLTDAVFSVVERRVVPRGVGPPRRLPARPGPH